MTEPSPSPADRFPTTHWSRVVRAGDPAAPGARAALAELCEAYWYPVYAFIRRKGHDPDAALDLTQDYFARLLEGRAIAAADPARGRFRAFLRTDCGFFLADQDDRRRARKRGGDRVALSIDAADAEGRYEIDPAHDLTPERAFDRDWALTLLDAVLARVGREYAESGRAALFDRLKGVLAGEADAPRYAAIAAELGTTEAAVEAAARRLRKRYREALRAAISATIDGPGSPDDEIRDLFAALGR